MPSSLAVSWDAYVEAEARGVRREYLAALEAFLRSLSACAPDVQARWVADYIERWSASGDKLPLRGPLLDQAVLPHLAAEFRSGSARAAMLLAKLRGSQLGSHRNWEKLRLPTEVELLAEAYRREPLLEEVRRRLVEIHVDYIRFTLHELPAGVLFGMNGASAAECSELEAFLDTVKQLMNASESAEYEPLLSEARFHYRTYREYLQRGDRSGYQAYLVKLKRG